MTLVPKQDFDVRQGKVELICTETYLLMTSSQYGQHYHRKTHDPESRRAARFMERGTVRAGLPHYGDVRLAVPADALPTLTGVSVNKIDPGISWTVAASLDVAKSRDIQHSQEVTVFRRAGPEDSSPRPACCGVQARPMCPHARAVIGRRAFGGQSGRQPAGRDVAGSGRVGGQGRAR